MRYLEQGNIALVMEALKERGLLRQNAPHLVHDLAVRRPQLRLVGDAVLRHRPEGLRPARRQVRLRPSQILSRDEVAARGCPTLRTDGLRGGVVYYDGQFDDARLLINLVQTAAEHGATLLNYAPVVGFIEGRATASIDGVTSRRSRKPDASFRRSRAQS